jgi:hypothetical protein
MSAEMGRRAKERISMTESSWAEGVSAANIAMKNRD